MANELRHGSVGTELTQAEWEGVGTHVLNSQASGDIIYASASDQLSRLAKATDGNLLELASGLPAWTSSPTIGSTSWGNANHAHAASNSGGTVAGSALSGSSLASGITSSSLTSVGTIATGVWQGTDVGVAYGGTGVSTLTDGGVLLGSGTSAVTAMAVLTDGQMIVGDGSTDPVAESGATLRTSIGVGTGDSPQFTDLTLTDDLILNSDSAVFSMGDGADFSITHDGSTAATIDVGGSGGSIVNVGGSNNDWTGTALTLGNGTQLQTKEGAWLKQAAESTSPHIYEVIGTTGAVSDNTSTDIVDITVPNQHTVGVLYLHYLTNSTAVDRVESGCIVVTFGRYQGSAVQHKIDADEASMPYSQGDNITGSETITVTASAAVSAGANDATQTFTVSITSDNSNGVNAITHWKANLMSSYAPAPNDSIYMTMAKA